METNFVIPSLMPCVVMKKQTRRKIGVYDGARVFDNNYYALLKNGVVTLYDYIDRQLFADSVLEDVWVAPNGYRLIKKKGANEWELYDELGQKTATGERVAVFNQDGWALVFLKQRGKAQWHFYNVDKNSYLPSVKSVDADEVEVRYDVFAPYSSRLMFILTSGGKTALQFINLLSLKPYREIRNAAYYEFLPDGSIAVADKPLTRCEGLGFARVVPEEGGLMTVYSADHKRYFDSRGIVMFSSGVFLRYDGSCWRTYLADRSQFGKEVYGIELYAGLMSYHIGVSGKTADGKPVKMTTYSEKDKKVLLEYVDKWLFIVGGKILVDAETGQDVFLI